VCGARFHDCIQIWLAGAAATLEATGGIGYVDSSFGSLQDAGGVQAAVSLRVK